MSPETRTSRFPWWIIIAPPLLLVAYGVQFMLSVSATRADLETTVERIRIFTAIEGALLEHRDTPENVDRSVILDHLRELEQDKSSAWLTQSESELVSELRERFDRTSIVATGSALSQHELTSLANRARQAVSLNRSKAGAISVTLGKKWNQLGMMVFASSVLAIALAVLLLRYLRLHREQWQTKRELVQREQQYRDLVETSGDLVWRIDCQGCWTFLNRSAAIQNLGHTPEDLLGRHFWDDGGDSAEADREFVRRLLAGESVVGYENTRRKSTGEQITLRWNGVPILEQNGTIVGASGTAADLTDLKQVETALRVRESRLRLHHNIASMSANRVSISEIIEQTIEQLFKMFPRYRSAYCTINPDGQITMLTCRQPLSMPDLKGMTANLNCAPEYLRRLKADSVIPVADVRNDSGMTPLIDQLASASIVALLDVPLKHSDSLMGVMCFDSPEVHEWTDNEIETLTGVAEALAVAIHIARTEKARREAETALRESENRFRQLAENIDQVFWLTDARDGKVIYVSPAYETIWGKSCDSVYESPLSWTDIIHPDDREQVVASFQAHSRRGDYNIEFRIRREDESIRWIHDRSMPVKNKDGSVFRIVGVSTDITERKLAESWLNEHEEELAHVGRLSALGEMATTLAHELNQPMCAISSYSQACMNLIGNQYADNGELIQVLNKVTGQAQRAGKIIRRINEFARKESLRLATVDLSQIIDNALELARAGAFRSGVRIIFDRPELPVHVCVDRLQIEQVVLNLIRNALDALHSTSQQDKLVRVKVNGKQPEFVEVQVSDNGKGIAPTTSKKVFEPFFTTKANGVGLGLSISRSIIEAHCGRLTLEPAPKQGATASFTLPKAGKVTA